MRRLLKRSVIALWKRAPIRATSTITAQLVKNLYFTPERSFTRKVLEIPLSLLLESLLSKKRILELYMNVVEWGKGVWGIDAASSHYFNKKPAELDPFEATLLSSLLPFPLQPWQGRVGRRLQERQNICILRLFFSGALSTSECATAYRRSARFHYRLQAGEVPSLPLVNEIGECSYATFCISRLCPPQTAQDALWDRSALTRENRERRHFEQQFTAKSRKRFLSTGDWRTLRRRRRGPDEMSQNSLGPGLGCEPGSDTI